MQKKIKYLDPSIERKKNLTNKNFQLLKNSKFPLPSEVEISESGVCNRKCSFCPRSAPDFKEVKEFISPSLHSKLINDLKKEDYKGVIRYSGFVEPMLDKNIYNLISETKEKLQFSRTEIVTNGDVLNIPRLKRLFKSGLSTLLISVYDGPEDAKKFEKMCKDAGLNQEQYIIRRRYLPESQDFGITLSNRAGSMKNAEYKIKPLDKAFNNPCYIPSYTFFLDYQGDVLMCPHDWGKKVILGNLNKEKFKEIWFKKKSMNYRKMLNNANRNFKPCNVCDVEGTFMGKKNSSYFN